MSKKSTNVGVGKKVLASALSAAMVVAFAPAIGAAVGSDDSVAYAEGVQTVENAVAQVGNQQYADVDEALATWGTQGGTLTLLGDCASTKPAVISQGISCMLDLAGHKLTVKYDDNKNGGWQGIKVSGQLTLNDSDTEGRGSIDFANAYTAAIAASDNGSIVMNGGTVASLCSSGSAGAVDLSNASKFQMNGGCLKNDNSGARYALKMNNSSSADIKAGTIGFINVFNSQGITLTVGEDSDSAEMPSVEKITAQNGNDKITLKSGIIGECSGSSAAWSFATSESLLFKKDVSSLLSSDLTTTPFAKDGTQYYMVVSATQENAEASLKKDGSDPCYGTVQQLAAMMSDGDTLKLLKDTKPTTGIAIKAAGVVVDLNGHKIESAGKYQAGLKFEIASQSGDYQTVESVKVVDTSSDGKGSIEAYRPISALATKCVADVNVDSKIKLTVDDGGIAVSLARGARMAKTSENVSLATSKSADNALWSVVTDQGEYLYGGASLEEVAATASDGKAKLLTDWKDIASLSYAESQDLTLDLDGHTITHTGGNPAINVGHAMTGKLSLQNGMIDASGSSASCIVQLIAENAKIDFENIVLKGKTAGIAANGSLSGATGSAAGSNVSIKGGSIELSDGIGIYWPSRSGKLELDGVKVYAHTGVQVCSGSLTVKGNTTISASGTPVQKIENDGAILDGSAISVINRNGYGDITGVSIEGGSFVSASAPAIKAYSWNNTDKKESPFDNTGNKLSVSGGTFSSDVSTYMDKDVSVEYAMNGDKTYIVQGKDVAAPANSSGFNSWTSADENGMRHEQYIAPSAPVTPVTPKPDPTPEPMPVAPGTDVSGTDSAGNTVEATVTDNNKTTLPDGTEVAGSVEFKGTTASSGAGSSEPAKNVDVPATVTANGSTYVVTKIADEAFAGQEQLESVSIPETVVEIGSKAFAGTSISKVIIPAATSTIGTGVFQGCKELESVDIKSAALTNIPADAFNGTALGSIDIPASVTSIGARAFKGTKLVSVELPTAVKSIAKGTFQNCSELTSVASNAKTVAKSTFAGCGSLKTVSLPKAAEVGAYAFSGTALKSVSLSKVETIGANAFKNAAKLKTLTTGSRLEGIGSKALAGAKNLKVLTVTSKKLTKKGVKNSLKGSSVKKVEVAVAGSKSTLAKYVAKYGKLFKKSNSGKSVSVVPAKKKSK